MMGYGVQGDFAEAYKWLSLAAAQGDPGAKFQCAATSIHSNLTAEGRRRAAAFVPKKENPVDEVERYLPRARQA
jgi:TPR repeat protein